LAFGCIGRGERGKRRKRRRRRRRRRLVVWVMLCVL
jgi:hypothetical protein